MNDNQLQQLLQAINTLQDLGKVAYFNKGAYNSETTYEINDVVTYQGSSYVSLGNNNQGNLPTNATYWSVVALKGDKGDTGKPFVIEKTYISIQEMVADYDNMNVNDYVMISGSIEDEQNATLWTKTETPAPTYKWVYLADFSGASGITGQTPNIQIGNVTEGNEPAVTRRQGSTNENPILDFVLKTGATGATGATGNGISQVSKTSTSGLTDTYTIEYTSGNSTTFDVTNGKGITSIAKTGASGLVDTYTITYNDGTTSTFTITNGEDGEVTQAQLDETNNQVAKANMVYNALPKVSDEGDNLTLDGTANCPMKMELKGNTEQTTYTGKNLLDSCYTYDIGYSTTINGITYTINEDKSISVKGTTGSSISLFNVNDNDGNAFTEFINKEVILTGTPANASNSQSWCGFYTSSYSGEKADTGSGKTVTLDNTYTRFIIRVGPNQTIDTKFYPMIRLSSVTDDTYEPYVGGTPSPNPDYPQDVRVVTGNNSVKVEGKNLCNNNYLNLALNYQTNEVISSDSSRTVYAKVPKNTDITISKTNVTNRFRVGLLNKIPEDQDTFYLAYINDDSSTLTTTINTGNYEYVAVQYTNQSQNTNLMIEKGSTATTYEPYQSQTYPINLGTIELCKIGTYQDYIYKDSGKWYKHSKIGKVVLDGSEIDWVKNQVLSTGFTLYHNSSSPFYNKVGNYGGYSNYFEVENSYTTWTANGKCGFNNGGTFWLRHTDTNINTLADFKTWLSTHNTIVYYVLATPTNEEITDTTLISQLNAIENAVSYDTQTNIVQENYSEPFIINAECVRSLKDIFELIGNS